jgi:hypothetical protein
MWCPYWTYPGLSCGDLEKGVGGVVETGNLPERVPVGVTAAPVVVLATEPSVEFQAPAGDVDVTGEAGKRSGDEALRLRKATVVEPSWQQVQRRFGAVVPQVPRDVAGASGCFAFAQAAAKAWSGL